MLRILLIVDPGSIAVVKRKAVFEVGIVKIVLKTPGEGF
jgi:hypothetical protein